MPNAKILSEKQAIVASLTEKFQNAAAGVIVDYKGITVAEDTELRAKMRENGVEYFVMKNTLSRFAAKNAGLDELCDVLGGDHFHRHLRGEIPPPPRWWLSSPRSWLTRTSSSSRLASWTARSSPWRRSRPWPTCPAERSWWPPFWAPSLPPIRGLATVLDANISGLAA